MIPMCGEEIRPRVIKALEKCGLYKKLNYDWGNIPLGGGGFVTGLIIHPLDPQIKYIRTDVGGAYRWNAEKEEWIPITDWLDREQVTWYGVDGMAVDPNNKDIVYMCCGDSGKPSDVLKSYDRGETWETTGLNKNFLGIDEQYTKGDKILAWSVFLWSFGYSFLILFVMVVVWNSFDRWDSDMWGIYFFIKQFAVTTIVGIITTIWFGICGTRDMFRLFKDLENRVNDPLDNGMVDGHVSLADKAKMEALDKEKAE
jgi:hypothetical protein